MNLEQIDTSTTAGKARVMQLAAEGRRVAYRDSTHDWEEKAAPVWNWVVGEYAIISEPVGPDEVWITVRGCDGMAMSRVHFHAPIPGPGCEHVRYVRADLAGEEG